jgi:hypothetical protein
MTAPAEGNGPPAYRKLKRVPKMIRDPKGQGGKPLGCGHFNDQGPVLPATDREAVRGQDA